MPCIKQTLSWQRGPKNAIAVSHYIDQTCKRLMAVIWGPLCKGQIYHATQCGHQITACCGVPNPDLVIRIRHFSSGSLKASILVKFVKNYKYLVSRSATCNLRPRTQFTSKTHKQRINETPEIISHVIYKIYNWFDVLYKHS